MRLLGSLIVILVFAAFSSAAFSQVVVNFPDPNLEAVIRDALGQPTGEIYDTDLTALTLLDADYSGISDLTGLEHCINLTDLRLSNNQISDINALAGLTNLFSVDLSFNSLADLTGLSGLVNLMALALDGNEITDLNPLGGLMNLFGLGLSENQISDISPLVDSTGISGMALLHLQLNPLSCDSLLVGIPALRARGVSVHWTDTDECSDIDSDGVADAEDNCTLVQNGPLAGLNDQLDTDADGYGNVCDCDFDQTLTCDIQDFNVFLSDFDSATDSGVGTDMNGDGQVGIDDLDLFLVCFTAGVPGPAGRMDCTDGIDNDGDGLIDFPDDPGCDDATDSSEKSPLLVCDDGIDNDGDGLIDSPADPGCTDPGGESEIDPPLACEDGLDNDADGLIDYPADPGCLAPTWPMEDPQCQDGIDNDGDGRIDFDGGLSALGYVAAEPDSGCPGPFWTDETEPRGGRRCGLGAELALALAPLMWLYRRRSRRV